MTSKSYLVYLRFFNAVDNLQRSNPAGKLDFLEIQLLEYILQRTNNQSTVLIGDLLKLTLLGSQATLHGRIKNLVANGFLKLTVDQRDCRKKKVHPTKLAFKYIDFMSKCMLKSL